MKQLSEYYVNFNIFDDDLPCCGGKMSQSCRVGYVEELIEKYR